MIIPCLFRYWGEGGGFTSKFQNNHRNLDLSYFGFCFQNSPKNLDPSYKTQLEFLWVILVEKTISYQTYARPIFSSPGQSPGRAIVLSPASTASALAKC